MARPDNLRIFSGNSNVELAQKIAEELGLTLGKMEVSRFSDGEIRVKVDESARGIDVFLIQSTCCPVNDNMMELL
ncbi:MAG: ribose-phosphate pyrophosphokinase-like domain-containing protein, partial [Armatimonadetes bacterium]|nr:ribose-phosphate pyrophosphokinase-like domain-containing protein [Armatimonadota bacterium]